MNEAENSTELTSNANTPPAAQIPPTPYPPINRAEAQILAEELATAYKRRMKYFEEMPQRTPEEEAAFRASEEGYKQQLRDTPPRSATWQTINQIQENDGEQAALRKFWDLKNAALDELQTGQRATKALVGGAASAWEWAEYCALLHELGADWQARNGIERTLLEQMAQAYTLQLYWTEILSGRTHWQARTLNRSEMQWELPRVNEAAALDTAAQMVDRWNRMFLRLLRQLRDLRRYSPPVIVQNAGQVNVASQQVNVSAPNGGG